MSIHTFDESYFSHESQEYNALKLYLFHESQDYNALNLYFSHESWEHIVFRETSVFRQSCVPN